MAPQNSRDTAAFTALPGQLPPFSLQTGEQSGVLAPALQEYADYYSLPFPTDEYWFGYIESGDYLCAAHLALPKGSLKGTVVLVHGFLSHFGFYQDLVPLLLADGWAIAGIDLPGHGLSTGTPTAIEDFSAYGTAIDSLLTRIEGLAPRPWRAIGHSMGAAGLLEYRLGGGREPEGYIFIAPLVRSTMYGLSQFGFALMQPFVDTLPRVYQKTTSDAAYLEFKEFHDPLQSDQVDPSWVRALFAWNGRIEESELPSMDLAIIQGDKDRVVDFRYNLEFLTSHIPGARVWMIPGGTT